MTQTQQDTQLEAQRLRVVFQETELLSLAKAEYRLRGLRSLLIVAYVAGLLGDDPELPPGRYDGLATQARYFVDDVPIRRIRYSSPLVISFEILSGSGSIVMTARSALYLMSRWEDWRAKRAWSSYQVAAYAMLQNSLPEQPDEGWFDRVQKTLKRKPAKEDRWGLTDEEKQSAASVIPLISHLELVSADEDDR